MVEYIVEVLLFRKGAAFSGKVVEYIVEVLLEGKVLPFRKGAPFQERWSSI